MKPSFFFKKVITLKTKILITSACKQQTKVQQFCFVQYVSIPHQQNGVIMLFFLLYIKYSSLSTSHIFSVYLFGFPGDEVANGFAEEAGQ